MHRTLNWKLIPYAIFTEQETLFVYLTQLFFSPCGKKLHAYAKSAVAFQENHTPFSDPQQQETDGVSRSSEEGKQRRKRNKKARNKKEEADASKESASRDRGGESQADNGHESSADDSSCSSTESDDSAAGEASRDVEAARKSSVENGQAACWSGSAIDQVQTLSPPLSGCTISAIPPVSGWIFIKGSYACSRSNYAPQFRLAIRA